MPNPQLSSTVFPKLALNCCFLHWVPVRAFLSLSRGLLLLTQMTRSTPSPRKWATRMLNRKALEDVEQGISTPETINNLCRFEGVSLFISLGILDIETLEGG